MPPIRAATLQAIHGAEMARAPLSAARSPYLLHKALQQRRPRIDTTLQAVITWWHKYRHPPDGSGERVQSVEALESEYGDSIREGIEEHEVE